MHIKKILFVFPTLRLGGAERIAVDFFNWLSKDDNYELHFFLFDEHNYFENHISEKINITSAKIKFTQINKFKKLFDLYIKVPFLLSKFISKKNIDVICSGYEYYPEITIFIASLFNFKLFFLKKVAFIHNDLVLHKKEASFFRKFLFYFLDAIRYKFFNRVVYINERLLDSARFRNISKETVITILNDFEKVKSLSEMEIENLQAYHNINLIELKNKYLLSASRFARQKNLELILKAYSLIANKIEDKLFFIGDISDEKYFVEITNLIESLRLSDRVFYLGKFANPYPIIKNAKALVISSYYEGWPMILNEAAVLETPIISVRFKNFPDIFENCVWLSENYDPFALSEYMSMSYDQLREKNLCSEKIFNTCDVSIVGKKIKELI